MIISRLIYFAVKGNVSFFFVANVLLWYIYTMEYYSAIKRNEIESFVEKWMDLETVIQSEVSQKEIGRASCRERV